MIVSVLDSGEHTNSLLQHPAISNKQGTQVTTQVEDTILFSLGQGYKNWGR